MDHKTFFLKHWERESPVTRRVLGRIPHDKADYRPDPKSRTARELAWVLVLEEIALGEGLVKGAIDWVDTPAPPTMAEILAVYDRRHPEVTKAMQAIEPARWAAPLPFLWGGQEVMKESAFDTAWGFLLDAIHHRGQLSTYLRPMGSTVPQIYGPSADEPM